MYVYSLYKQFICICIHVRFEEVYGSILSSLFLNEKLGNPQIPEFSVYVLQVFLKYANVQNHEGHRSPVANP